MSNQSYLQCLFSVVLKTLLWSPQFCCQLDHLHIFYCLLPPVSLLRDEINQMLQYLQIQCLINDSVLHFM